MEKILAKDQATYSKERDGFLRDLQHFHETRGTPIKRAPTLGGKEVDLYLLYMIVTSQGGWLRVNSKNSWSDILLQLQLPRACINGSVALKQIYLRYLDRWEKVHFLHEEGDRASDDDEESRHKRWSARTLHCVPYTYNYNQHNVSETNREYNHLATNLYKSSDYDRLALSLISPLPNEQDFAINVCTLLSNDGKHTLKLQKHPRLITYLLGHAGVFNHSSLRNLFVHFYSDIRKQPIHNFWRDVIEVKDFLELTNENNFKLRRDVDDAPPDVPPKEGADAAVAAATAAATALLPSITPMEVDVGAVTTVSPPSETVCTVHESDSESEDEILPKDSDCDNVKATYDDDVDNELFGLKRSLGTQDYVGQRVLQIATILRNLSFIEENITLLVKNTSFIRFLLLCCTSQWNILRNLGMDMLGNLAPEFIVRDLQTDVLAVNLLKVVTKGLQDQDRACCLSALEVLNKLSQNEKNEDILLRSLEPEVYRNVCSFLTIHDVMLLIYTLECLYSLSSLGERSCHLIVNNHGVIDTLVSLVTVEGKSYGPKACIGMKLVETLPSGSSQAQQQSSSTTSSSTTTTTTSVSTATTTTASTCTPIVSTAPVARVATPTTPLRPVSVAPQRLIAMTPAPTPPPPTPPTPPTVCVNVPTVTVHQVPPQTPVPVQPLQPAVSTHPMTPQQLIQQQHAHQQAIHENEQFALAWLRAAYEPCLDGGKVDHQELYRHYMNSCSKIGRRGVISPLHFPRCVRSVFGGTVGPNPMKPQHPNDPQYYEGIKVRDNPLVINIQQQQQQQQHTLLPKINVAPFTAAKGQQARRKSTVQAMTTTTAAASVPLTVSPVEGLDSASQVCSPASPILKAQLSAPPKQRESVIATSAANASSKGDMKSQAMSHPHLSQALLGTAAATAAASSVASAATVTVVASSCGASSNAANQTSSTSLIKSLLATKVNDCMSTTVSMRTATDCQNVAQVAARQQRLLAQGGGGSTPDPQKIKLNETPKICRMNGVRQLFNDNDIGDPSVSSTTQFTSLIKGKKEPPQPPPPPLAPLSNNLKGGKTQRIDNEDSDSIGNNSVASSSGIGTVGIGGISSTEDGDNSLTCFEGLLNGIPSIDQHALNEDSNSKDSMRIVSSEMAINKPLRLADLLEKKFEKSPPLLNGTLGKDIKMGDKAMDLVENHIEKALSRETDIIVKLEDPIENVLSNLKRSASDENIHVDAKKPMLSSNFNGSTTADSPNPDSVSSSNGDETSATVSTAAAKLFADIAADILEDEDEEQLLQEVQVPTQMIDQTGQVQMTAQSPLQQIIVDNNQQMLLTQPRQIIVSQSQPTNQVMINTGTPMKTQTGQTVIVQNAGGGGGQRPVMLQQANAGQFMLQQGQMQLVHQSGGHQYVLQTGGSQGAYVVAAQPQTAVVHGQPQTVLVAQTQQQQGAPAKTIIILQQQAAATPQPTHHQKVVVTPQGQQVVVTQVPRPIAHTSSMSNNAVQCSGKVTKSVVTSTGVTQTVTANGTTDKRKEDVKPKLKVVRDLTTPYVCEWGECNVETKFKSANEVYLHVCACHCPTGNEEIICLWDRCDNMKRKRFSLMTHLHDKHCNTEVMRQGLIRRKQAAHTAKVETTTPSSSSSHPGYAPDAALHAIKRHALEFVNPKELQDDNEGPVTKSIRLTASLILRNLVIYSSHCKRYLKSYESHLANVALSNVESSRTIAQVLYDMNDGTTHR